VHAIREILARLRTSVSDDRYFLQENLNGTIVDKRQLTADNKLEASHPELVSAGQIVGIRENVRAATSTVQERQQTLCERSSSIPSRIEPPDTWAIAGDHHPQSPPSLATYLASRPTREFPQSEGNSCDQFENMSAPCDFSSSEPCTSLSQRRKTEANAVAADPGQELPADRRRASDSRDDNLNDSSSSSGGGRRSRNRRRGRGPRGHLTGSARNAGPSLLHKADSEKRSDATSESDSAPYPEIRATPKAKRMTSSPAPARQKESKIYTPSSAMPDANGLAASTPHTPLQEPLASDRPPTVSSSLTSTRSVSADPEAIDCQLPKSDPSESAPYTPEATWGGSRGLDKDGFDPLGEEWRRSDDLPWT
jgi:hypothetical protein